MADVKSYVEYDSNNSGGRWWLTDDDWRALEAAGWRVHWTSLEHAYTDNGEYIYEDGLPKLVPVGEGNSGFRSLVKPGENGEYRWLGALAKSALKAGATSLRDAAAEWEQITGKSALDAGCACCGQPHYFRLYVDGKSVECGPDAEYVARW